MGPASLSGDGSIPLTPPRRMGSAEKRSCSGDGRACFPCLESTSKGRRCFRRQVKMLLERMLTNSPKQKHAHHAEGVQYAIKSFADGAYGGACSVMMPGRSTRTCRARSEVKILPRSWKIIAGLPKQGQGCSHPASPTRRSFPQGFV